MGCCFDRERDKWQDTPLCNLCVHKRPGIRCDTFPDGIPMDILRSGEHFLPVALYLKEKNNKHISILPSAISFSHIPFWVAHHDLPRGPGDRRSYPLARNCACFTV